MKCQLKGYNLKVFAKGVRLFSKLSNEVLVIAENNKLRLQAINDFKTVFIELQFERQFFSSYECQTEIKCKLFIKSLILVFRVLNIEKVVTTCTMIMADDMPRVVFEMNCRNEVKREYYLPYMESSHLRYTSNISQTNPSFRVEAKVLNECFQNFSSITKDVSVWLTSDKVLFKSYYDDIEQEDVTTLFSYRTSIFSDYVINNQIAVTFNLKDLKNFVDFALFGGQTISCYFEASGRPIEFAVQADGFYSARMMLATHDFPEDQVPLPPSLPRSTQPSMSLISSGDLSMATSTVINNGNRNDHNIAFSSTANTQQPVESRADPMNDEEMGDDDLDQVLSNVVFQVPSSIREQSQMPDDPQLTSPVDQEGSPTDIFDTVDDQSYSSDDSLGEILVPESDEEN